mgnify:CR=1 FL=1
MPKITSITSKKLVKILRNLGFQLDHSTGSHFVFYHPETKKRVVVPFHKRDLPKGTITSILREAGISRKELENLVYDTNIDCNYFNNSNLKHKRYERAIETFDKIIKLYPFHIVGLYCRALAFLGMGRNDEAEKDFKECVLWISKNEESKRLFERYGNKMGCLKAYIEK